MLVVRIRCVCVYIYILHRPRIKTWNIVDVSRTNHMPIDMLARFCWGNASGPRLGQYRLADVLGLPAPKPVYSGNVHHLKTHELEM